MTTPTKSTGIRPKQANSKVQKTPDPNVKIRLPSLMDFPVFAMIFPHQWDTDDPNNTWMQDEMTDEEAMEDFQLCYRQWMDLYDKIAGNNVHVITLPSIGDFPDAVYVANIGVMVLHQDKPVFVGSNFKSPPRRGEEKAAMDFFKADGYKTVQCPFFFEGEADLKNIRDNIYIGAYGIRTERKALDWFEKTFDAKVIPVEMTNEKNYHLDTEIFPITADKVLVATSMLKPEEIKAIEKVAEITEVPKRLVMAGTTNCVRTQNLLLCGSSAKALEFDPQADRELLKEDLAKVEFLAEVARDNGLELCTPNLSEIAKSGADLSCCLFHVNRAQYRTPLLPPKKG